MFERDSGHIEQLFSEKKILVFLKKPLPTVFLDVLSVLFNLESQVTSMYLSPSA